MSYKIKGKVIKGDGYGKKLGFPTANLDIRCLSEIKAGVYAGSATIDDVKYRAGIVVRPRGKVDPVRSRARVDNTSLEDRGAATSNGIEAHLIGFEGDLYDMEITLTIKKFLREYKKFETEEELKEQIKKDLEQC